MSNRREILKGLAVGAPMVWAKPVVDSVILPVHASTTGASYWGLAIQGVGVGDISPPETGLHVCVSVMNDMATVTIQGGGNNARRQGVVPTDGTRADAASIGTSPGCPPSVPSFEILVIAISPSEITIGVRGSQQSADPDNSGFNVTVPANTCGTFPDLDGVCN